MDNTLFISDLHLSPERKALTKLFTDFVRQCAGNTQRLYILGDLFEVWLGDDASDDYADGIGQALLGLHGLGTDIAETITRMKELENIITTLPGIDCGSCGAPTCRAFAEDVVLNKAHVTDCTFKLREQLQRLAKEMSNLAELLPPTLNTRGKAEKHGTEEDSR